MKKKRHTTEQVIQILRKADGEKTVEESCQDSNISEQTFYGWRRKYGRMKMADLKCFKELEKENTNSRRCWPIRCLRSGYWRRRSNKSDKRRGEAAGSAEDCPERGMFGEASLPISGVCSFELPIPDIKRSTIMPSTWCVVL